MGHRVVRGLKWARALAQRPSFIPLARPRGAKGAGLRYERSLGKMLPKSWLAGQWWEFEDAEGLGVCQTDFWWTGLMQTGLVLEVKYTWVPEAETQLTKLYIPVMELALGRSIRGIVVCRTLTREAPRAHGRLADAIAATLGAKPPVWHWLEKTPVNPRVGPFDRPQVALADLMG